MSTTSVPAIPANGANGADDALVRCLRCEYSLRGLDRGGNCPECGTPIERSWRRHELELAQGWVPLELVSASFLRRMGWGCGLVVGAAAGTMGNMTLNVATDRTGVFAAVAAILWMMSSAALVIGLRLLGTPEPLRPRSRNRLAYVIRGGAILFVVQMIGLIWALRALAPGAFDWYRIHSYIATGLTLIITWAVLLRLAAMLTRSVAERKWAMIAQRLAWAWPAAMIVQAVGFPMINVGPSQAWMVTPMPVAGTVTASVLIAYTLITWPRFELVHVVWLLLVAMTLLTMVVLVRCALVFFSTAKRDRN